MFGLPGVHWPRKPRPVLYIPSGVMQQLQAYVNHCPVEINGFGLVYKLTSYFYQVEEVFVVDQIASLNRVSVDAEAIGRKVVELVGRNAEQHRRLQWHSHVWGDAFFSHIDRRNIWQWDAPWLISLVLNKHGQVAARLDVFRWGIPRTQELDVVVTFEYDFGTSVRALEDIAEHVRFTEPTWGLRSFFK